MSQGLMDILLEVEDVFKKAKREIAKEIVNQKSFNIKSNGYAFDKERIKALLYGKTKDIQAYPGTGKTTLLTNKISLLLKHWHLKNNGILVLSHTNVAKDQIRQISYPHYLDTIHGFANKFFGLPYVRKKEIKNRIKILDNRAFFQKFKQCIGLNAKLKITNNFKENFNINKNKKQKKYNKNEYPLSFFEKKNLPNEEDFFNIILEKTIQRKFNNNSIDVFEEATNNLFRAKLKRCYEDGYFSYDSLLWISLKLIQEYPFLVHAIRRRFPVVFIDEAQDNCKLQNKLLYELFLNESICKEKSIVQRFGDINQKIYNGEEFDDWKFPGNKIEIKSSHRCKEKIAKFASNFVKEGEGFKGFQDGGHLFYILFNEANKDKVIEIFIKKIKEMKINSGVAIGHNNVNTKLKISSYHENFNKEEKKEYYKTLEEVLSFSESIIKESGNCNKAYNILLKVISEDINYKNQTDQEKKIIIKDKINEIINNLKLFNQKIEIKSKALINKITDKNTEILINTIHGVKGETHQAVLVLDTRFGNKKDTQLQDILKNAKNHLNREIFFVAFSRATDVLCLAIQKTECNKIKNLLDSYGFEMLE